MRHLLADAPAELGHTNLNSFLIVDLRSWACRPPFVALADLAETVCHSAVFDAVAVLESDSGVAARVRVVGGDRREVDLSANALMLVAARLGAEGKTETVRITTSLGMRRALRIREQWRVEVARVREIPVDANALRRRGLDPDPVRGAVHAGAPHLVLSRPAAWRGRAVLRAAFEAFAAPYCTALGLAGGVNVTLLEDAGPGGLRIRTYRCSSARQVASSGTGAVAAAAVYHGAHHGPAVRVNAPGGDHLVRRNVDLWTATATPRRAARGALGELVPLRVAQCGTAVRSYQ